MYERDNGDDRIHVPRRRSKVGAPPLVLPAAPKLQGQYNELAKDVRKASEELESLCEEAFNHTSDEHDAGGDKDANPSTGEVTSETKAPAGEFVTPSHAIREANGTLRLNNTETGPFPSPHAESTNKRNEKDAAAAATPPSTTRKARDVLDSLDQILALFETPNLATPTSPSTPPKLPTIEQLERTRDQLMEQSAATKAEGMPDFLSDVIEQVDRLILEENAHGGEKTTTPPADGNGDDATKVRKPKDKRTQAPAVASPATKKAELKNWNPNLARISMLQSPRSQPQSTGPPQQAPPAQPVNGTHIRDRRTSNLSQYDDMDDTELENILGLGINVKPLTIRKKAERKEDGAGDGGASVSPRTKAAEEGPAGSSEEGKERLQEVVDEEILGSSPPGQSVPVVSVSKRRPRMFQQELEPIAEQMSSSGSQCPTP
ncbi:hypothetical protein KEM55_008385, partial [Ascosphaera atra]